MLAKKRAKTSKYGQRMKGNPLRTSLKLKVIEVCNRKLAEKGSKVGLSFYAFFANKNDDPDLLMEAAEWWIKTHKLDHFEKAEKIKTMVQSEL